MCVGEEPRNHLTAILHQNFKKYLHKFYNCREKEMLKYYGK